ncbi:Gfo/Idh/MocA family protein [Aquiflexum sp.]|uniref:Gfo/Idh/MocA family protein n=1 Tax=Aquiflexum sp. TaxID=1872584 RepID=UPI0035935B9E
MERKLKFAVIGTGFWADYQIQAWKETDAVALVAVCDTDLEKAKNAASRHGAAGYYQDASELLDIEELDFVDIISSIPSHAPLVKMAAMAGIHVICQKPMAEEWETCRQMVRVCEQAGIKFFIHENFRFQTPIRACKTFLQEGKIGTPFKARLTFCSGFPVFENQPELAKLDRFIIMDLGVHILDVSRFLFGEVERIYCQTQKINPKIKGEDVANILITMQNGLNCFIEISYASVLEEETFPQTLILIEGDAGSLRLDKDFIITLTQKGKDSEVIKADPPQFSWADPNYALIHSSIVACNQNILADLLGEAKAETTGSDNLKTVELVFLSYESDLQNKPLNPKK